MEQQIQNPKRGEKRSIGKCTYNNLIREGFTHNRQHNVLLPVQTSHLEGAIGNARGQTGGNSLLDTDVPDIGVEPLKPTAFQAIRSKIVKNAGRMADWLWKLVQNRGKNANDIADWILNQKDKIINQILPPKIMELIDFSKKTRYTLNEGEYWKINMPSIGNSNIAIKKVGEKRQKYEKECESKYLKM